MSDTRKHDREDIGKARDKAKSVRERERYSSILNKINSESSKVSKLRENLVKAVRGSDIRAVKYYQEKIRREH